MVKPKPDRRIERTRETVLRAFVSLYFERDYDSISVADIAARANVGRSTFYEHFRGKDALLAASHRHPFTILASSVDHDSDMSALHALFDHFWSHRGKVPSWRNVSLRRALGRALADLIIVRLQARAKAASARVAADRLRWAAVAIAELLLGSISVWLSGEFSAPPHAFADALQRQAQAVALTACAV